MANDKENLGITEEAMEEYHSKIQGEPLQGMTPLDMLLLMPSVGLGLKGGQWAVPKILKPLIKFLKEKLPKFSPPPRVSKEGAENIKAIIDKYKIAEPGAKGTSFYKRVTGTNVPTPGTRPLPKGGYQYRTPKTSPWARVGSPDKGGNLYRTPKTSPWSQVGPPSKESIKMWENILKHPSGVPGTGNLLKKLLPLLFLTKQNTKEVNNDI